LNGDHPLDEEARYRLLSFLHDHPEASQREVASALGMSVGKVNYCLKALIEKGWIKARNFKNSRNKAGYIYALTPKGIEEKLDVTVAFLRRKMKEYDEIAQDIERLRADVQRMKNL
jgi:EPS-associated MarR family transcriptional regulator